MNRGRQQLMLRPPRPDSLGSRQLAALHHFGVQHQGAVPHRDVNLATLVGEHAEQDQFGKRLLQVLLDDTRHRARAHERVIALLGQPGTGIGIDIQLHVLVVELGLQFDQELVDHIADHRRVQRRTG